MHSPENVMANLTVSIIEIAEFNIAGIMIYSEIANVFAN